MNAIAATVAATIAMITVASATGVPTTPAQRPAASALAQIFGSAPRNVTRTYTGGLQVGPNIGSQPIDLHGPLATVGGAPICTSRKAITAFLDLALNVQGFSNPSDAEDCFFIKPDIVALTTYRPQDATYRIVEVLLIAPESCYESEVWTCIFCLQNVAVAWPRDKAGRNCQRPAIRLAQGRSVWQGKNGWEIALASVPDHGMQCMLLQVTPNFDHELAWIWDDAYGLFLMFTDRNFQAMNDRNYDEPNSAGREKFVVSVDGDVLEDRGDIRTIVTLPSGEQVALMPPRLLAYDQNNPGEWTRPTTQQIFDKLRKGKTLKIETYGVTYKDNLMGVASAIALFPKCIAERNRLSDQGN